MSQGCVEPPEAERDKTGSSRGIVALLTPRFWASGLQNAVKIDSSCFMSLPSPHWQSFVVAAPGRWPLGCGVRVPCGSRLEAVGLGGHLQTCTLVFLW